MPWSGDRGGRDAFLSYAGALLIGGAFVLVLLPPGAVLGTGGLWASPPGDTAQSLTGHLAFQGDSWRWPPLTTRALLWPHGVSVALTDSNPAASLLAKALRTSLGAGPLNLLGAWLALCVALQPAAAVYAFRAVVRDRPEAALAVGVLAASFPAWLFRVGHVNLMGHFVILGALGLALRLLAGPVRHGWVWAGCLLCGGVLFHPYLFVLSAAVLAAVPLDAMIRSWRGALRPWAAWLAACTAALLLFRVLSGGLGGGDRGFGVFSMNLLSPVWPQWSGLFGAGLPLLDATQGQYEGFNYLGGGALLLALLAGALLARRPARVPSGLLVVLAALVLLALSNRVYAGGVKLLDLGAKPWEDLFAPIRASGRAFWPVGYALLIGAAATVVLRLPRRVGAAVLAVAAMAQFVDAGPLRRRAADHFAGADAAAPDGVALPERTALLTVAPSSMCMTDQVMRARAVSLLLRAARDGVRLGDVGVARSPRWFNCEKALADGLETPLAPGEARVFAGAALASIRMAALGDGARCGQSGGVAVCSRDEEPAGAPVPAGATLPRVSGAAAGAALRPLLSSGWHVDGAGAAWSEGPYATLLFSADHVPPGRGLRVTLHIQGIAARAGGTRAVALIAGRREAGTLLLRDGAPATAEVAFTPEEAAAGVIRVALAMNRPVDPAKRGLDAPVRRAGLRLTGVEAALAEPP